jgi:EmrB/QacA subfamily drug resistance transporter
VHFRIVAVVIAFALFMQHLDSTVLATALPAMARDFHASAPELSVTITAYLLALAIFIPASGHAADRWGGRNVFRGAIVLFCAGSVACALAANLWTMGLARFGQGIGGAMMVPVGRLVLLRTVSKRDLVAAQSWLVMPGMLGQILGPPLGGFIVTYLDWRWIFWINLPIGAAGIYMVTRFVPADRPEGQRPFDIQGFLMSALALSTLVFGLESTVRGGVSGHAGWLIGTGVTTALLYIRHARRSTHPILDLSLLRIPTFRLALIGGAFARTIIGAQPFLVPLMLQLAFGLRAAQSGVITMATALGSIAMKGLTVPVLRRLGFRKGLTLAGVLSACCCGVCGLFRPGWPLPLIFAMLVLTGFLMSFQTSAYNAIAYDEIDSARMSTATSLYFTLQQLTISLGVMLGASVLRLSMSAAGRAAPSFQDFTLAFIVVMAVSMCSAFANLRFDPRAGSEMSGIR